LFCIVTDNHINDLADSDMLVKLKIGKSNYYPNWLLLELLKKITCI